MFRFFYQPKVGPRILIGFQTAMGDVVDVTVSMLFMGAGIGGWAWMNYAAKQAAIQETLGEKPAPAISSRPGHSKS